MKSKLAISVVTLAASFLILYSAGLAGNADFPPGDEGARQLLMSFFSSGTDKAALTMSLQPNQKDYQAYFREAFADQAMNYYKSLWDSNPVIATKTGQTQLLLIKATTDELISGAPVAQEFPGGYSKVVDKLNPGLTVYRFKFVKPGETMGMAFDGLVHVNGHWVLFPKPWRALK